MTTHFATNAVPIAVAGTASALAAGAAKLDAPVQAAVSPTPLAVGEDSEAEAFGELEVLTLLAP